MALKIPQRFQNNIQQIVEKVVILRFCALIDLLFFFFLVFYEFDHSMSEKYKKAERNIL